MVSKIVNEIRFFELSLLKYNENVANKGQILIENGDKQSQNTHVEVNIFARQKSKARKRVWIVQNNLHIAET